MGKGSGYAFGTFIAIPILIAVVNFLFFRGNQVTQEQVTQYINESSTIELFIPEEVFSEELCKDLYELNRENNHAAYYSRYSAECETTNSERSIKTHHIYYPKITRRSEPKVMNRSMFYSQKYGKYFALFNFDGFEYDGNIDHNSLDRVPVLIKGGYFMVRVNNKQLSDLGYGSEKNPIPVFEVTLSGRGYEDIDPKRLAEDRLHSDVSEKVNRIFVEQYLNNFISNGSFNKLFYK